MSIELPDLVQRIRVKTDELRAAEKLVARTGKKFDVLRASTADASDQMDEFADSTDRANDSLGRTERVTSGATRALSVLHRSTDDARTSMGDAGDEASRLGQAAQGAADDVGDLGDAAGDASREVESMGRSSRETSRDQDTLGRSTRATTGTIGSFIKKVLAAGGVLKILSLAIGSLKLAAIVAVIGQLGSGLISAAAGATAFVSAIAPAAGIIGALPAGILAFASSALALKAIFGPASDAVEAINKYGVASDEAKEAAAGLSKQNLAFVNSYAGFKNVLGQVSAAIQGAGLPGFTSALTQVGSVVRAVKDELGTLGGTLGLLAQRGAELVSSGPFSRDLQTILSRNNELVYTLGKAGLQLVNVLRNIMVAAGPMTQALADLALQGAKWLNTVIESGRKSGALQAFFRDALQVTKQLGRTLADFGVGLFNVFSIGRALGDDLFQTLTKNARVFREWTESASGRSAILDFFNDARPVLTQFGKLVTATFREFFTLQDDIDFASTLKQIRKDLLPAVADAIRYFGSSGLTSAIINAATAFTELFNTLPINPIVEVLNAVSNLTRALIDVGKAHPIILQVIASLLVMRSALKAIAIFGKFTGLTTLVNTLRGAGPAGTAGAKGIAGFVQGLRGASGEGASFANKIGTGLRGGLTKAFSGLKGIGSKALTGIFGPAGQVGKTGLTGFVQGLRNNVDEAGTAANRLGARLRNGFTRATTGAFDAVKGFGTKLSGGFKSAFGRVRDVIVRNKTSDVIDRSLGRTTGFKARAAKLGKDITSGLKTGLSKVKGVVLKAGKDTAGAFTTGFSKAKAPITRAAKNTGDIVKRGLANAGRGAKAAGSLVAKGFTSGLSAIKTGASAALSGLGTIFTALRGPILAAAGAVRAFTLALLTNPIFLVVTAIVALGAALVIAYQRSETFRKIVDATFGFIRDVVVTAVTTVVNFVRDNWKLIAVLITGPIGIVVGLVVRYWDQISGAFEAAVNFIRGIITRYFTLYRTIITTAFNVYRAIVSRYWGIIRGVFVGAFNAIRAVIVRYWAIYRTIFRTAFGVIRAVVSTAWRFITGIFRGAMNAIRLTVQVGMVLVRRFIIEPIQTVVGVIRSVWNTIVGIFRERVNAAVDTVRGIRDRIIGFFANAVNWLYNIGRSIIQGLIDGVTSMFGPLEDAFNWVTDRIPDWKGPIGKDEVLLYGAGRAIMRGLTKGINEGTGEVRSALGNVTREVRNGVQIPDVKFPSPTTLTPDQFAGNGQDGRNAVKKINRTGLIKDFQAQMLRQAKQAAEAENRLRAKLPLLQGDERKAARQRIRELQAEQRKFTRRAGAVESTKDLRVQRQAALKRADQLAKQARDLRVQLPGLEGEDKRKAKEQIAELEKARGQEIRKAQEIQNEMLKAFRDLPKQVRDALREAQNERRRKREKEERKAKEKDAAMGGGSGGPSGTSSDPVFTSLNPTGPGGGGKDKDGKSDASRERREIARNVKANDRTLQRFGRRIPDAVTGSARDTQKTVVGSGRAVGLTFTKVDNSNARSIITSIREGRGEQEETRKNAKVLSAAERAQIRDARNRANRDAADARALERTLYSNSKAQWDRNRAAQVVSQQNAATAIVAAIRQVQAQTLSVPTGTQRTPDNKKPPNDVGKTVTYNTTINNPRGEPAEDSINARLRRLEVMGRRG